MRAAKGSGKPVPYDLLFNICFDPCSSAVNRAKSRNMFGVKVPVAQPLDLALIWLVAVPNNSQSRTDLVTYIQAGLVDIEKLRKEIKVSDPALGLAKNFEDVYNNNLGEGKNRTWSQVQESLIARMQIKKDQKGKYNYKKPSADRCISDQEANTVDVIAEKLIKQLKGKPD